MELSRQMLLLTAENYGSYYLHITILPNTKTIISKNIEEEDLSGHVFLVANGVKIKHVYYKGAAVVFE